MVSLKASYTVKPAEATPTGILYLSEFDQFITRTHSSIVYFYPQITDEFVSNPIEILKNSLSKTLTIFYPVAGRLQWTHRRRLELNCNSMGALFLEMESEAKINDFGDFSPTAETKTLIPSVDYEQPIEEIPLLLVQLTKFSCGGISLGLGMSHVLSDGKCGADLVSEWARIARGCSEKPVKLPVFDRMTLKPVLENRTEVRFDHSELGTPPILIGQRNNFEERKKATIATNLKLSKQHIQKLKNEANEFRYGDDHNKPFTRYEAVTAHMWRCASKARQHESEQLTSVRVVTNFRNRVIPPMPEEYVGNGVLPVTATATSGELLSKPLGYVCSKVRKAVEKVTDEFVSSTLAYLKREEDLSKFTPFHVEGSSRGAFFGNPNIAITSWIGLSSLFNVDFGWGKEMYVGPATVGYDGKSFILPGSDGSIVIAFQLQVAHMDAFKKFFYENIENMSRAHVVPSTPSYDGLATYESHPSSKM